MHMTHEDLEDKTADQLADIVLMGIELGGWEDINRDLYVRRMAAVMDALHSAALAEYHAEKAGA